MNFKPHDRVVIGGATMLRPGFSLVGHTGTVLATGSMAPPGQVQVIVDDEVVIDADSARALVVNVPTAHLELLEPAFVPALAPVAPLGPVAPVAPLGSATTSASEQPVHSPHSGPRADRDSRGGADTDGEPPSNDKAGASGLRLV